MLKFILLSLGLIAITVFFPISAISYTIPTVSNVRIVRDDSGAPLNIFNTATIVRIHAKVTDPEGIKYVRAMVKDDSNKLVSIISLYNDGSTKHGDNASATNGSSGGANDDIYSAKWIIPYSFKANISYSISIEATDIYGYKYNSEEESIQNSDPYELNFFVDQVCNSGTFDCSNGDFQCSGNMVQKCFVDGANSCSY